MKVQHCTDLHDAASEAAHRMAVTLILLRHLENHPLDSHGGYTLAVAQEVIELSRDRLQAGINDAATLDLPVGRSKKKGGAR